MRNLILGTDWWTDCDDVVALRILARAHKSGDICIKGIGINGCMEFSVASLDGFLKTEGVPSIKSLICFGVISFGLIVIFRKTSLETSFHSAQNSGKFPR